MTPSWYRYKSEFARRYFDKGVAAGRARGEAKGKARALLVCLRARGITVDEATVARVEECVENKEIGQLDAWLDRAAVALSAGEVFGD